MSKRSFLAAVACTAAIAGASASAAFAGEVTGNGKDTQGPAHANSICAFSGREDENAAGSPLRTQTPHEVWLNEELSGVPGGVVANPAPGTPGVACRGGSNTGE